MTTNDATNDATMTTNTTANDATNTNDTNPHAIARENYKAARAKFESAKLQNAAMQYAKALGKLYYTTESLLEKSLDYGKLNAEYEMLADLVVGIEQAALALDDLALARYTPSMERMRVDAGNVASAAREARDALDNANLVLSLDCHSRFDMLKIIENALIVLKHNLPRPRAGQTAAAKR